MPNLVFLGLRIRPSNPVPLWRNARRQLFTRRQFVENGIEFQTSFLEAKMSQNSLLRHWFTAPLSCLCVSLDGLYKAFETLVAMCFTPIWFLEEIVSQNSFEHVNLRNRGHVCAFQWVVRKFESLWDTRGNVLQTYFFGWSVWLKPYFGMYISIEFWIALGCWNERVPWEEMSCMSDQVGWRIFTIATFPIVRWIGTCKKKMADTFCEVSLQLNQ